MLSQVSDLRRWFFIELSNCRVHEELLPYVVAVMSRPSFEGIESDSIVLTTARCRTFTQAQAIGDLVLWKSSFVQGYAHQSIMESCGRWAYERCYVLANKRINAYGMLADALPSVALNVHEALRYLRAEGERA